MIALLILALVFSGNASVREPLSGYATWYATPGRVAAAGPVLREALGDFRGQSVTVCHDERCTTVRLTDWCLCRDRSGAPTLLDLSDTAFRDLAPLSAGVIEVTIAVEGPRMTLPPTDTLPSEPRRELHSRVL